MTEKEKAINYLIKNPDAFDWNFDTDGTDSKYVAEAETADIQYTVTVGYHRSRFNQCYYFIEFSDKNETFKYCSNIEGGTYMDELYNAICKVYLAQRENNAENEFFKKFNDYFN